MNEKVKRILSIALPYVLLAIFTIVSCYLYFYDGIAKGDDTNFHLGHMYDICYGLRHGHPIDSTNHIFLGAYSYNTHLFYGPFPHYFGALFMFIFNATPIVAFKFTLFFFTYIGGLFFYFFALKITKKKSLSVIAAAVYIFFPYRMFCAIHRIAFAEAIAMCIIPIFFYGIYGICHDNEVKYRNYLAIVLGATLLVLSHPFTSMMCAIFAVIYMVFRYKNIINIFKSPKGIIVTASSLVLIVGLIGFYFFPMVKASGSGLYRISDDVAVWTNYDYIAKTTGDSYSYSGFLDTLLIAKRIRQGKWPDTENVTIILWSVYCFVTSAIATVITDYFIQKAPKNKYYRFIVDAVACVIPIIFFVQRIEIYLACAAFFISFVFIQLFYEGGDEIEFNLDAFKMKKETILEVAFLVSSLILLLVFLFSGKAWLILPDIFYKAQFSWRLWSIFNFLAAWLIILIILFVSRFKSKIPLATISITPFLLFALSDAYIEKRIAITYEKSGVTIYKTYDDYNIKRMVIVGAMNEYAPLCFYTDGYTSEYENSLYDKVKSTLGHPAQYVYTKEKYLAPAFLEGEGSMTITYLNIPTSKFDASITSDTALIQIPQFYYSGYVIRFKDKSTNKTVYKTTGKEVDGLVTFTANKGEYEVEVKYEGDNLKKTFNVIFFISLAPLSALTAFSVLELINERKNKKVAVE